MSFRMALQIHVYAPSCSLGFTINPKTGNYIVSIFANRWYVLLCGKNTEGQNFQTLLVHMENAKLKQNYISGGVYFRN